MEPDNLQNPAKTKPTPQDVARAMYARDGLAHSLNITVSVLQAGHCRARMVIRDDMVNIHGLCHDGMTFTLAGTAFTYASHSENNAAVTSAATITFLRPARVGETLTAECVERARQHKTGVFDVSVTDEGGQVVAIFQGLSKTITGEAVPGLDPSRDGMRDILETEIVTLPDIF